MSRWFAIAFAFLFTLCGGVFIGHEIAQPPTPMSLVVEKRVPDYSYAETLSVYYKGHIERQREQVKCLIGLVEYYNGDCTRLNREFCNLKDEVGALRATKAFYREMTGVDFQLEVVR